MPPETRGPLAEPDATAQFIGATLPQVCPGLIGFRLAYVSPGAFKIVAHAPTASAAMALREAAKVAMADLERIVAGAGREAA